jgi:hypothetical protein
VRIALISYVYDIGIIYTSSFRNDESLGEAGAMVDRVLGMPGR